MWTQDLGAAINFLPEHRLRLIQAAAHVCILRALASEHKEDGAAVRGTRAPHAQRIAGFERTNRIFAALAQHCLPMAVGVAAYLKRVSHVSKRRAVVLPQEARQVVAARL